MQTALIHILQNYLAARREPFERHGLAAFMRGDLAGAVRQSLPHGDADLLVIGSAGQGRWSDSPWISIMDPVVTDSPQSGYYVSYLFPLSMKWLVLSLQVGTTRLREEFGLPGAKAQLARLTDLIRMRVPEYLPRLSDIRIDLESAPSSRASLYEAAHAFGRVYPASLPTEEELCADLHEMIRLYRTLTFRGGVDTDIGEPRESTDAHPLQGDEDPRRIRLHRRIERNAALVREVKRTHGYSCEACGFDFERAYGPIGHHFIEAHHLVPIAALPQDKATSLNVRDDFAVLCANCHRMIHRKDAPTSLDTFRQLVRGRGANEEGSVIAPQEA